MEYLEAVLKLPVILNLFACGSDAKFVRARRIIVISNVVYYAGILVWLLLNKFDKQDLYNSYTCRIIVSLL